MEKVTCIDVSYSQTNIDFKKVKAAGITSVIIRAGYGRETSQKDKQFETHYKNAKAAGLKVGAYWYSYANGVADAKKEAAACLECIKGKIFNLPVYYDLEDNSQIQLGMKKLTEIAKAFCNTLKAEGYRVGVYANANWFRNYLDYTALKKLYSIWLANYSTVNALDCDIWQNSSTGKVNGISGNVDTNVILNYNVIKSSASPQVLDKKGYKKGNKTIGVLALKQMLLIAYKKKLITKKVKNDKGFGEGTEKAVNQLLKKWGYKQNSIAGEKFIKKLGILLKNK